MIEGRPRESLVLYDNAIEVSPHFKQVFASYSF
jgi:hypothetical protein